jgi:GT2 family glycosyltransferase/nucleoside-diphosphate-sugar epimerase
LNSTLPQENKNFLITGANGFVGRALCEEMLHRGLNVRAAVRSNGQLLNGTEVITVGNIDGNTDWTDALRDMDVVIHLAARVHVMKDAAVDPLAEFLKINLYGTANLAQQAALAGVKRLIYVSSIKVNGERTTITPSPSDNSASAYVDGGLLPFDESGGREGRGVFFESDKPDPQDPYAISKWQAEQALHRIAQETALEVVVLRPPLVYGPGVKGNFIKLLAAVDKGIPLPLARVDNTSSLIYLGNLVDILLACANNPAATGKTYLVRDGEDISIPELIRQSSKGLGRPARVFSIPVKLLRGLGALCGQLDSVDRIVGSLRISDDLIRKELGWKPRFTLQQGLRATTEWYTAQHHPSSIPYLNKRSENVNIGCLVSIVIVNYNAGEVLLECVAGAHSQSEQVVVVDNASTDNSIDLLRIAFPTIQVICNERNLGFAAACNIGAMVADGDHVFFLNPDCILEPNAVSNLIEAVNSADNVGLVGGLLTNPDGTEQSGGRRAVPTPWRSFVRSFGLGSLHTSFPRLFFDFDLHKQRLPDCPVEVEAISGACMLARRDSLEDVGLLDEGYFMHCEDLDWCMRFRQRGWKILFVPDARMIHHKGYCSKDRPIFVEWNKHKGMIRFYNKFFRHRYPWFLAGLAAVGVWTRFVFIMGYHLRDRILRGLRLRHGETS